MAENEKRASYIAHENENFGSVRIADDVIAWIAGLAATEVEGVSSIAGNITNELLTMLGVKNLSRSLKLQVDGDEVSVALSLIIQYGYSIPKVSNEVQDRVKATVENMTGLHVTEVSVYIAGVDTTKNR